MIQLALRLCTRPGTPTKTVSKRTTGTTGTSFPPLSPPPPSLPKFQPLPQSQVFFSLIMLITQICALGTGTTESTTEGDDTITTSEMTTSTEIMDDPCDRCHRDAVCAHLIGIAGTCPTCVTKQCQCQDGFIGDGEHCIQDPCRKCHENALCNAGMGIQGK